ncbi:MAPK-activated protein kinase Srk1 [Pleurotus ostreatus]|nr:MAPK-activated protein kinase Srk1 [Pleurotus ostreatus]
MPTGTGHGVVDAFKNLIRHGKHHNHAKQDNPPAAERESRFSSSSTRAQHHQQAQQQQPQQQQALLVNAQNTHAGQQPIPQPREAVEQIVLEEKEAKAKMPVYKGLEQFKLLDKMGDGAFSNVYKALDLSTGKKVAVKVVRKFELNAAQAGEKHLNPQFKKRPRVTERSNILKEVQIMRGTNHPAIVRLLSFSESPEHYFIVLELMEGGELFHQIVKLTYFSENLSRHVILQVAQGIRYLHEERGVVHRDIKPENLLFDRIPIVPSKHPVKRPYDEEKEDEGEFIPGVGGGGIGRVKIADFGLSKVVWNEETMTPCGTVGYTAPEIVKDERYSKSVDMWALGCVLYTLLCGFPPFYDESINVLTEKVARGYYTFLSPWWDDISGSAKDLISHLLCVDPAQRYTIDEFLSHPWCTASPAPPPPPTPNVYGKASFLGGRPLDSPLLTAARGGLVEGRSPGLANLKEAFDITYAVHRMEEEGARRKLYGGRQRLAGLNEESDEEDDDDDTEDEIEQAKQQSRSAVIPGQRQANQYRTGDDQRRDFDAGLAGIRDQGHHGYGGQRRTRKPVGGGTKGFELDMQAATLLGRRHQRGGAMNVASPLSGKPMNLNTGHDSPNSGRQGSPMHIG